MLMSEHFRYTCFRMANGASIEHSVDVAEEMMRLTPTIVLRALLGTDPRFFAGTVAGPSSSLLGRVEAARL